MTHRCKRMEEKALSWKEKLGFGVLAIGAVGIFAWSINQPVPISSQGQRLAELLKPYPNMAEILKLASYSGVVDEAIYILANS